LGILDFSVLFYGKIVRTHYFIVHKALSNNLVIFKLFAHMLTIFISSASGKPSKADGIWTSHPNSSVTPFKALLKP